MIKRIWRGWTSPEHADAYQQLLESRVVPGIIARRIAGLSGIEILRRDGESDDVEFVTIMTFDGWDAIREFAGGDGRGSVVPDEARQLLSHFDAHSTHFDVVAEHSADANA